MVVHTFIEISCLTHVCGSFFAGMKDRDVPFFKVASVFACLSSARNQSTATFLELVAKSRPKGDVFIFC